MELYQLQNILCRDVNPSEWHRHPNGGGWVENTAHVDPTACVGPEAVVFDRAHVLDFAAVEGSAAVYDDACVSDRAVISGESCIFGRAHIYGSARICDLTAVSGNAQVGDRAYIHEYAEISGNAQVGGDVRIGGNMNITGDEQLYLEDGEIDLNGVEVSSGGVAIGNLRSVRIERMVAANPMQWVWEEYMIGSEKPRPFPLYLEEKYNDLLISLSSTDKEEK
jgi:acyl-[acyl carrier protein]--UDP-N-acetylglucosamine O-acyltransferase